MHHRTLSVALVILFAACPVTLLAQQKKRLVITDPATAHRDFHVQGEYEGTLDLDGLERRFGVQVIALGDAQFDAVGYWGGLPGAGWDSSGKLRLSGKTEGAVTTLSRKRGGGRRRRAAIVVARATIEFGELTVRGPDGGVLGKLPRVVRKSPTLRRQPAAGGIVLFDGTSADNFDKGRMTWSGLLKQGTNSKKMVQSCQVHLEFRVPFMPGDRGQDRANSGCYVQGRYEVQILDSFGLEGKHNECGGIYSVAEPTVNMAFPPLTWQTYDIDFTAAKFDDQGKKTANPRMTVRHNGVLVHDNVEIPKGETTAAPRKEGPGPGPIYLQAHGGEVRYRNIWVVTK